MVVEVAEVVVPVLCGIAEEAVLVVLVDNNDGSGQPSDHLLPSILCLNLTQMGVFWIILPLPTLYLNLTEYGSLHSFLPSHLCT